MRPSDPSASECPSPSECLRPWSPSTKAPWDRRRASHLLRRTRFGATEQEIGRAVGEGLEATLERQLKPPAPSTEERALLGAEEAILARKDTATLAAWWLQRMIATTDPLRDKCALLWHGHFACSDDKVQSSRLMAAQFNTFREHGLGDLRTLVRHISRDPAMQRFLDGNASRKGAPNENFARELLELFVLGRGQYEESDVKAAARAFTGYRENRGSFQLVRRLHDSGPKTFLGVTGPLDGDQIISICFTQPAAARHFARRIASGFLCGELPDPYLETLAKELIAVDFQVSTFLERLLRSELFFSQSNYRALIKSPIEYTVGAIRSFEGQVNGKALHEQLASQGQRLFRPPGVQGWAGGIAWLTSSRLTARNRFAFQFARNGKALGARHERSTGASHSLLTKLLLDDELSPTVRTELEAFSGSPPDLLHTLLMLPEYQVG